MDEKLIVEILKEILERDKRRDRERRKWERKIEQNYFFENHERTLGNRFRNKFYATALSALIAIGGGAGIFLNHESSALNEDNINENTLSLSKNSDHIQKINQKLTKLETKSEFLSPDSGQIAFCTCVRKNVDRIQEVIYCPTERPVCDEEASRICQQAVGEEYEC